MTNHAQELWDGLVGSFEGYEEECSIRADYSGRGMYGKTCVGIVASDPVAAFADLLQECIDFEQEELLQYAVDLLRNSCRDSMGTQSILYFPGWQATDSRSEEEQEDEDE